MVRRGDFGGRDKRTPGVRTTKRTARTRGIKNIIVVIYYPPEISGVTGADCADEAEFFAA